MDGSVIVLPKDWHTYVLTEGVREDRPGIYEWRIEGVGVYVGKYTRISRPKKQYGRNLFNILNSKPYRPRNPNGFRRVHRELERAYRERRTITLTILENVSPAELNRRERELIVERRANLNGPVAGLQISN